VAIEPGQQLLHYRLIEKIGEGGMGVVWKAEDTKLNREVAIKVLPAAVAQDPERLARFDREAKLLASLNHPNIAAVYGLHEQAEIRFLAMEYVRGEDLAARLARGRMTVDDALDIARQVADALQSAHESGVVHRDLKPGNVLITPEGRAKVLDFGLAKAFEADPSAPVSPTLSPTLTSTGTLPGVILGTAAYMSPEQARGEPVDKRADVWAFGCVLFEMLTGRMSFKEVTISDTLASVLKVEPDWDLLPVDLPDSIRRLLKRCLEKQPRQRLHDIADARIEIEATLADPHAASTSRGEHVRRCGSPAADPACNHGSASSTCRGRRPADRPPVCACRPRGSCATFRRARRGEARSATALDSGDLARRSHDRLRVRWHALAARPRSGRAAAPRGYGRCECSLLVARQLTHRLSRRSDLLAHRKGRRTAHADLRRGCRRFFRKLGTG
jgi:serine/threonine protein kinase